MSIQKFPLEALQKIRQHITSALVLPTTERQPPSVKTFEEADELPEPESLDALGSLFQFGGASDPAFTADRDGEWFVSAVNPGAALVRLPGLRLKPGFRLVSYLYRTDKNDHKGIVWAVPEDLSTTNLLEAVLDRAGDLNNPPKPQGALSDIFLALEGDRSAASFLVASILRREFAEFGAAGKHRRWAHHRLIDRVPSQLQPDWKTPPPPELSPRVRLFPDGRAAVEFFSCRVVAPIAIFRHVDQYGEGEYLGNCSDRAIALASVVKR